MRHSRAGRYRVSLLTDDELRRCRARARAELQLGRTRGLSLAWLDNEQRETERAYRLGYEYQVERTHTKLELIRLEELKWLPFKRRRYENPWGGGAAQARPRALLASPPRCRWVYAPDALDGDKVRGVRVRGPVALAMLVQLIRSRSGGRDVGEEMWVGPEGDQYSLSCAYRWAAIATRLPLDLPGLCSAWARSSRRPGAGRSFWGWEKAHRLIESDPRLGWRIICALVRSAPSNGVLGHVGAGPIEDFVQMYPAWHSRVVARARRDRRFRWALGRVRRAHLTRQMMEVAGRGVP